MSQLERNRLSWKKYRENNRETICEKSKIRMRKKRLEDPEGVRFYQRLWRKTNPNKTKTYDHKNYYKNREQKLEKKKEYYKKNKLEMLTKHKNWWKNTSQSYRIISNAKNREYYRHNKTKINSRIKNYQKQNPQILLKSMKNYLKKVGDWYNKKEHPTYMAAFIDWSKTIKKRDNDKCQICGNKADVSHHILFKAKFPELSLNENNGITLCNIHHNEIHCLNGR